MNGSRDDIDRSGRGVRAVSRELYQALQDDAWPSRAALVDFGIASPEHFGALQYAVNSEGVTLEQLDTALGRGERLQGLFSETNPYRFVTFVTDWDELLQEPEEG